MAARRPAFAACERKCQARARADARADARRSLCVCASAAPAPTRPAPLRAFFDAEKEDSDDVPFDVEARAVGRWLTRPFSEYSGEEGFNVFLAVFHGYCFYEAATKGAFPWLFTGFSFSWMSRFKALSVITSVASSLSK